MAAKPSAAPALKKTPAKVSAKAAPNAPEPTPREPSPARQSKNAPGRIMTEAEILKAPDKEYMNAAQLAFFKNRLQEMEQEILKNAGETTEHLRETIIVPDPADRATIEEEHALELRTRDRERKLLKKIQQSIVRIDSGDYGYCEETGDPIGVPRLLARPTATLSLEAQERREMKQKMYGE
jgi:DnaK suppressor protein